MTYTHHAHDGITIPCPCCQRGMPRALVTCWACYRASDRLTPGTYRDRSILRGHATISAELVAQWDAARADRMGWS